MKQLFWSLLFWLSIAPTAQARHPDLDTELKRGIFTFAYQARYQPLAQDLASVAEAALAKMTADLGGRPPPHIDVLLARNNAQMRALAPRGARVPIWAAGMAFLRSDLILLKLEGPGSDAARIEQVLVHEQAHLALAHAVKFREVPRWFSEGFAMFQAGESTFSRIKTLAGGVLADRLFSLDALTERFPDQVSEVNLAYAQSIDFISYLLSEHGPHPFHRLIQLLADQWSFLAALEEAYDRPLKDIEDQWQQDLRLRFTWIPLITGTATLWFLVSIIFLMAYLRKRRLRQEGLLRLDQEEAGEYPPPPPGGWVH